MYLDLADQNWPDSKSISKNLLISSILLGNNSFDMSLLSEDEVEKDSIASKIQFVLDADSSQHAAITDVLKGRNLVIQGPPGTGKSQTITNIISAALSQGKTVLFAAEKLAALEVVKRNLNKVGLGEFCLELHSHKANKKKVLEDLRIRRDKMYSNTLTLDEQIKKLEGIRETLHKYTNLLHMQAGPKGESIYDIFWIAERYRTQFES